jgi:hypothetical protein
MKLFLHNIFHFSVLVFSFFTIICFCLNLFPESWSSYSYSITNNIKEYIESEIDKEIIVIGDSRAMAGLAPKLIDPNSVYNLSIGGGTPISGYYTLKKMLEKQKTPKTIILSYAPFHLIVDDTYPRPISEDFFTFNEISELYSEINKSDTMFWDIEKLNYSKSNFINLSQAYLIKIKFPTFFLAEIKNSKFLRSSDNRRVKNKVANNMGAFAYGNRKYCDDYNQETEYIEFKENKIISEYLKKILNLANDNNIQVIYITAPINKASDNIIKQKLREDYSSYFSSLKKEFPKVIFYSELRSFGNQYFGDASHLNNNGRIKFSNQVKTILVDEARTHNKELR